MTPEESKRMLFKLAERISVVANSLMERIGGMDTGYEGDFEVWCEHGGAYMYVAGIIFHSAARDFETVFLLLDRELLNGAFLSFRRLFELSVDLRFIGRCPKERAGQFLNFVSIQEGERLQYIEEYWPGVEFDREKRSAILRNYRIAKSRLGYKPKQEPRTRWSSCSLEGKCKRNRLGKGICWYLQEILNVYTSNTKGIDVFY